MHGGGAAVFICIQYPYWVIYIEVILMRICRANKKPAIGRVFEKSYSKCD
jgi:hypothetical protein